MTIENIKIIFLLPIFAIASINLCFSQNKDATYLRKKFYLSVDNSETSKSFIQELTNNKVHSDPLINGYLAATNMVMAKHAINPYKKLKFFSDGKKQLEAIIQKNEKNIELRMIRFAVQSNAPFFLGYSKDIDNDKKYLLDNLGKLKNTLADKELAQIIISYLQKSGLCTKEELENIQKHAY